ncbi:MAG: hypothetical protein WDL87_07995 [Candidatus Omnitrophota bacterium]|jgi:hypothetical protein
MFKKTFFAVVILFFVFIGIYSLPKKPSFFPRTVPKDVHSVAALKPSSSAIVVPVGGKKPHYAGERIVYNVKLGKISLGKATLENVELTRKEGKLVNLIRFETKVTGLTDVEKIYCDPEGFFPLWVEREVYKFPSDEKIIETYDQKNFILTIRKQKGRHQSELIIKKDTVIQNALLLPYYVRSIPEIQVGWSLPVQLPTQQFIIRLVSIDDITIPAGMFRAYHFESEPKKFEIWISADNRRIPLKIKGLSGIGYVLSMKEYLRNSTVASEK